MTTDYYVEEACYYLTELKVKSQEIAKHLSISTDQVAYAVKQYKKKIGSGEVSFEEETEKFWSLILRENSGDEKITLVDEKGRYYHGWRTELEKLPTEDLVELLVVNKKYSDRHPLSEFSKSPPVVGYDPLVPLRNIRRTVSFIDKILQQRAAERRKKRKSFRITRRPMRGTKLHSGPTTRR